MVEDTNSALAGIQRTLEEIKSILILLNQDKLSEIRRNLLKEGSVKMQIYELCDGTKGTKDLAATLQKSMDYVSSYISILRREGLVRTVDKNGMHVYEQVI